ncbi:MAG: hypothetical protein JWP61_293 [Friedmanniella sp.]|nr:hypothetical protein [Friedmanniella sp.]
MAQTRELTLELGDADADPTELDADARRLRSRLLDLDVEDVTALSGGTAPPGSKGAELLMAGGLLVTLLQTPGLLTSIVSSAGTWLSGRSSRSLKVTMDGDTLELSAASDLEREAVVGAWLAKHGDQAQPGPE